jgi:hypothetical protein
MPEPPKYAGLCARSSKDTMSDAQPLTRTLEAVRAALHVVMTDAARFSSPEQRPS